MTLSAPVAVILLIIVIANRKKLLKPNFVFGMLVGAVFALGTPWTPELINLLNGWGQAILAFLGSLVQGHLGQ